MLFSCKICRIPIDAKDEITSVDGFKSALYRVIQTLFGSRHSNIHIDILKCTASQIIIKVLNEESVEIVAQSLPLITNINGRGCTIITDKISSFLFLL